MKFNDFKYERPNYEQFKNEFGALVYKFEAATNAEEQLEIVNKINAMRSHIETMATLSSIRHSIDTRDEFYDSEQTYWDEQGPLYEEATSAFYHAIVKSPFRAELEEKLSKQFFTIAEFNLRSFSPEIIADLQLGRFYKRKINYRANIRNY